MKQNIGNIGLDIHTNLENIADDIQKPSAHSLHTNWRYWNTAQTTREVILENSSSESIHIDVNENSLVVKGNIDFLLQEWFNPQFLVTGNKWILSKYISHVWEDIWLVSLHACAIHHPETWKVIIGIWSSWSGKTALVSSAIINWWQIIATEMLQIDDQWVILPWNTYDVIWKTAEQFFKNESWLAVPVFSKDTIFDQTGSKCLADFSPFGVWDDFRARVEDAEIVFLQFGDDKFTGWVDVDDSDMALRFISHSASEKIDTSTYVGNHIVSLWLYWNPSFRDGVIHMIHTKAASQKILWWWIDGFQKYL